MGTYGALTLYEMKQLEKIGKVIDDYLLEEDAIQYRFLEQEQIIENECRKEKQNIEKENQKQMKIITESTNLQRAKHYTICEQKLRRAYKTHLGVEIKGRPTAELFDELSKVFDAGENGILESAESFRENFLSSDITS